MAKKLDIRIMDLDAGRLMVAEGVVKIAVRKTGKKAHVTMMADNLGITRQGLMDRVPLIVIDGKIVSESKPILLPDVVKLLEGLE
ncbi:MAG: hypothetical protein HOD92_11060 [Deltaproteobacteria bacterium]|jgi:hypothetical protein|nr:hypothetical protein [Deltaproteobacteria bacterium]